MKYVLALAASALIAAPAVAGPAAYPKPSSFATGSFRQSCADVTFKADNPWVLTASCGMKKDYGERREYASPSINFTGCDAGSIGNYDGKLQCIRSDASLMQHMALKNSVAVRSAAVLVMGVDPEWATLQKWYAYGWKTNPAFKTADLDFSTAALTLRDYLVKAATLDEVHAVEAAAFQQVYGKPHASAQPNSIVVWSYQDAIKSGKTWYAPLVLDMRKAKNAPPPPQSTTPLPPIH